MSYRGFRGPRIHRDTERVVEIGLERLVGPFELGKEWRDKRSLVAFLLLL